MISVGRAEESLHALNIFVQLCCATLRTDDLSIFNLLLYITLTLLLHEIMQMGISNGNPRDDKRYVQINVTQNKKKQVRSGSGQLRLHKVR